ncbi:sulfatase family protein [Zobellia uliginosa]|uniref:sulfatase family protein n=1 Tax=Zobellia uliginosa TaxID=143224 RepID=UPI0026E36D5B|nr:arylsulfatase [Zobellia uliginosa]MDO6518133.1 arylsulfatase [Zobellia uliginosa]
MRTKLLYLALILAPLVPCASQTTTELPNIVVVFADDLGYGDVGYMNPKSKIKTPNIDQIAEQGISFTDAHSASAVCSPSRYGLLTGRYAWRTKLKKSVLWGYSSPLIPTNRLTIASMLKEKGYHTACIGKWHLGLDWALKDDKNPIVGVKEETFGGDKIDFTKPIKSGPTELGFDYFFGHSASLDMPPYVFIENDRLTNIPTVKRKEGFGRYGYADASLEPKDYLMSISDKASEVITKNAKNKAPFFLYLALPSPHTPLAVADKFKNSSTIGDYGDYVIETDWVVGEVVKALEKNGLSQNTLLIVTSDNGPETMMIDRKAKYDHYSAGELKGCKRDNWEGGHRIPFLAKWPKKIKAGSVSNEVLCLTDLMRTFAAVTDIQVADNAGEDSYNMLPALLGSNGKKPIREATIHHSSSGKFAIRKGDWVLLLHPGSGGNDRKYQASVPDLMQEPIALYNLKNDIRQKNNVYKEHPEIVAELTALTKKYIEQGRSIKGSFQKNDPYDGSWELPNSIKL